MANVSTAVGMVVEYIVSAGLFNFKSLEEGTQRALIGAYGANFEHQVNAQLTM